MLDNYNRAFAITQASPAVILGTRGEQPMVLGEYMPLLSLANYYALSVLYEAAPQRISAVELYLRIKAVIKAEKGCRVRQVLDPARGLRRLASVHPNWRIVLLLPGNRHDLGYGLLRDWPENLVH